MRTAVGSYRLALLADFGSHPGEMAKAAKVSITKLHIITIYGFWMGSKSLWEIAIHIAIASQSI